MNRYQDLSASELGLNFSANNKRSSPAFSSTACSIEAPCLQELCSLNSTHCIWNLSLLWNQTHFSTSVAPSSKGYATEEGQHPPQHTCWHSWKRCSTLHISELAARSQSLRATCSTQKIVEEHGQGLSLKALLLLVPILTHIVFCNCLVRSVIAEQFRLPPPVCLSSPQWAQLYATFERD